MNFRFTKLKTTLIIILSIIFSGILGFVILTSSYDAPAQQAWQNLFDNIPPLLLWVLILAVITYVVWSLLQKRA